MQNGSKSIGVDVGSSFWTLFKLLGTIFNNKCNIYGVLGDSNEEYKTPFVPVDKEMLWHRRWGYIVEKGLQALRGKCMVEGMFDFLLEFNLCEHCIYGKK